MHLLIFSWRHALRVDTPGCFVTRFLQVFATEHVNTMNLKQAKLYLQIAKNIERILYQLRSRNANKSIANRLAFLYAQYKYETYFGDFEKAAQLREKMVCLCRSALEQTQYVNIRRFELVAAMEKIPFTKLVHFLEKRENEIQLEQKVLEIKKFMKIAIDLASKHSPYMDIIGPNYSASIDCDSMRNKSVCLNKALDYKLCEDASLSCDIVYINRNFLLQQGFVPKDRNKPIARLRCRIEDSAQAKMMLKDMENIVCDFYHRPNYLFMNGYANMAQAAVYDLIMHSHKVKLIGLDLFTHQELYTKDHHTYTKTKKETSAVLRTHDLLSNFAFLKVLYREGLIKAEGSVTIVNDLSVPQYAKKIQQNLGFLEC